MEFARAKARTRPVPIVSLIDILFIVLIFFIITSEFKKEREVLKIEFPTVEEVPSETIVDDRSVLAVSSEGLITGKFSIESENGKIGYEGEMRGRLSFLSEDSLGVFECLVVGSHWGEGPWTKGARPGKKVKHCGCVSKDQGERE